MQAATKTITSEAAAHPYIVQLDALRAFAVAAVMIHHYLPGGWKFGAYTGVKLFFTISGFLITGILLRARDEALASDGQRISALARFYARRFLRIFPLYYAVVAVAFAINLKPARELIVWLLTYTLNIHMAQQGWFEAHFAHFWSLSVEEQFYVFWPWFALFLPRRFLVPAALAMVATGPVYRLSYVLSGYRNMTQISTYISTLSCMDNLGMGALLAMIIHANPQSGARERCVKHWILPLAVVATAAVERWGSVNVTLVIGNPVEAVAFCGLIYGASRRFTGPLGRLLEWKTFRYLGKISYGLYVYHPLMLELGIFLLGLAGVSLVRESWLVRLLAVALTLVVASLSWRLMEKPFISLKRYFEKASHGPTIA